MRFRKKPVEVEAVQMPSIMGDFTLAPTWLKEAMDRGDVKYIYDDKFTVHTLEGVMSGFTGDFIIRGVRGELYACKREIFMETYEPAHTAAKGTL
jgi:hypothetical protein